MGCPLHRCCTISYIKEEIVQMLLENDQIDVNKFTSGNVAPFYAACRMNNFTAMRLLAADSRVDIDRDKIVSYIFLFINNYVLISSKVELFCQKNLKFLIINQKTADTYFQIATRCDLTLDDLINPKFNLDREKQQIISLISENSKKFKSARK